MTYEKRSASINWRKYLTSDERQELEALEREVAHMDRRRREITPQLRRIRDRCEKRARTAREREAAA